MSVADPSNYTLFGQPGGLTGPPTAPPTDPGMDVLAAQAAAASQAAQAQAAQSGSAYQAATLAPPNNLFALHPLAIAAMQGLSRVAQGLGQRAAPEDTQRALTEHQQQLMVRRLQNLQALHDVYEQQATRASKLADTETEMKYRALSERTAAMRAKLHDEITQEIALHAQQGETERARLGRQSAQDIATAHDRTLLAIEGMKAAQSPLALLMHMNSPQLAKPGEVPQPLVGYAEKTDTGTVWIDKTRLPAGDTGNVLNVLASQQPNKERSGYPVLDAQDAQAVRQISSTRANLRNMLNVLASIAPADAIRRAAGAPQRAFSTFLQTDDQRVAFKAWGINALKLLRAAGPGGLRITQQEYNRALGQQPTANDTWGTIMRKYTNLSHLLDNSERSALGLPYSAKAQPFTILVRDMLEPQRAPIPIPVQYLQRSLADKTHQFVIEPVQE